MNLEKVAQSVYEEMDDGRKQFDPAAIVAILQLIIEFLPKFLDLWETFSRDQKES